MKEEIKPFFMWDDELQVFSIPSLSKRKKYHYGDLLSFQLYAAGVPADVDSIRNRLKAKENYIDYISFSSLWIELEIREEESIRIVFYNTPYLAGESLRLKYVNQSIQILDKLAMIKGEK